MRHYLYQEKKEKKRTFCQIKPSPPPSLFSGVHVTHSSVFHVAFCLLLFVLFLLAIVMSVLRFTDSNYPCGIFKFVYCFTKKPNTHIIIMVDTPEAC